MSLSNPSLAAPAVAPSVNWRRIGYYLVVLLPIALYAYLGHAGFRSLEANTSWSAFIIAIQIPMLIYQVGLCLVCMTGILLFRVPVDRRPGANWRWDPKVKLIVAYVSRGNQPATLKRASSETQSLLDALDVEYALEVVTDFEIPLENRLSPTGSDIFYYVVPPDYQTKSGARFKARALQYLLEQRTERLGGREHADNVWILHLDEESIVTPECLLGISEHIAKYDLRHTAGAIGQGEILYNSHHYGDNLLVTAIDSIRTGQDLGLFRLAFKMHLPLIGMHGSYVLTPATVERDITWDVGGAGSVTEDAYFALAAMQRGVTFDWVEGFIREQSPFTIPDIVRQRRRWFCGLRLVAFDPVLKLRTTLFLRLSVVLWAMGALAFPLPFVYLFQRLAYGTSVLPYWAFVLGAVCWGMYGSQYALGTYRNLLHCKLPFTRKMWIAMSSMFVWLWNIPTLVETTAVIYGMIYPVTTFYVVAKDSEAPSDTTPSDAAPEPVLESVHANC